MGRLHLTSFQNYCTPPKFLTVADSNRKQTLNDFTTSELQHLKNKVAASYRQSKYELRPSRLMIFPIQLHAKVFISISLEIVMQNSIKMFAASFSPICIHNLRPLHSLAVSNSVLLAIIFTFKGLLICSGIHERLFSQRPRTHSADILFAANILIPAK